MSEEDKNKKSTSFNPVVFSSTPSKIVGDFYATPGDESKIRLAAYTASFARAARYLAFTSDLGEALRPVVSRTIVNLTYGISAGYCVCDVAYAAYELKQRNGISPTGEPMSMTQLVVERSVFQLVASLLIPALLVHKTVDLGHMITKKIGRFQRWGPSIAGLAVVPFLPLYLDEPIEHAIEHVFHNYGPWAKDPVAVKIAEEAAKKKDD